MLKGGVNLKDTGKKDVNVKSRQSLKYNLEKEIGLSNEGNEVETK